MIFGNQLFVKRKKLKLSTEALAIACGISRSYVTLIENGKRMPSKKIIPKIAEALEVHTDDVINWYLEDVREKLK